MSALFLLDAMVPLSFVLVLSSKGGASDDAFTANDLMCSLRRAWILSMMRVILVLGLKVFLCLLSMLSRSHL